MRIRSGLSAAALLAGATFAPALQAQGRLVDEGTLLVTRSGVAAGRETFRIVHVPSGSGELYRATAQVAQAERRIMPSLLTDSMGAPISYDVSLRNGGPGVERLQARTRPGRFSAVLQTAHGESAKEYAVPAHTVVLDEGIYHQYYFLGLATPGTAVTVLCPLASSQYTARLELRGTDAVDIGGRSVQATHLALVAAGHPSSDFWVDSAGRVLRVSIPERGITVQRDELPR